jgi:NDP-sugar pyrophosphorylase family protein
VSPPLPSALILAAGLGTRLRPLTYVRAKAAAPVAGTPLIGRVLAWLASQGFTDVVVNLHHLPASITRVAGDGEAWRLRVRYSWEPVVLGSAGGPRHALPLLASDPFLIVNADTLTDVDVGGLLAAHAASGAAVTMAVVPNHAPDRYGGVLVAADGAVEGFTRRGDSRPSFHFIGVQAAAARVFQPLADGVPADSVGGVYRDLLARVPGAVRAFISRAGFHDIGSPRDYLATSIDLARAEGLAGLPCGARARVAPTATLVNTALWDDTVVGERCTLTECVVADGAAVPDGTVLTRCAIVPAAAYPAAGDLAAPGVEPVRRLDDCVVTGF